MLSDVVVTPGVQQGVPVIGSMSHVGSVQLVVPLWAMYLVFEDPVKRGLSGVE